MTFGETVVNVVKVSATSSGTAYTVPAGRYAIAYVNRSSSTGTDPGGGAVTFAGTTLTVSTGGSSSLIQGVQLGMASGDTVVLSGTGSFNNEFNALILEFNNP